MRRLAIMALALALCGCGSYANDSVDKPAMEDFDVVEYEKPPWVGTDAEPRAYKLTERGTGRQYWLVNMSHASGGWVVVPIGDDG